MSLLSYSYKCALLLLLTAVHAHKSDSDAVQKSHSHSHGHSQHGHKPSPHKEVTPVGEPDQYDPKVYTGSYAKPVSTKHRSDLPTEFDWCNNHERGGQSFCTASWNQHIPVYCGSCYIHGALAQANDRIKILQHGRQDVILARQVILNCGPEHGLGAGCDGGEGYDIFEYMYRYGLPDESCQQYMAKESGSCNSIDICSNCMPIGEDIYPFKCWAVEDPILYYVHSYGQVSGELAMMSEIYERGPITCGFASTDDFDYNYQGGIYYDKTNATEMNHDVEVVGWGVEDDVPYWIARNSWGTYWGENSFFRIVRGVNNMMFETDCTFAIMDTTALNRVNEGELIGSMYGLHAPNITDNNNDKHSHKQAAIAVPTANEEEYQYFLRHGSDKHVEYQHVKTLVDVVAMELNSVAHHATHAHTHKHHKHHHTHKSHHTKSSHSRSSDDGVDTDTPDSAAQQQQNVSEILDGVAKIIHEATGFVPSNGGVSSDDTSTQHQPQGTVPDWQQFIPGNQPDHNQPIYHTTHHKTASHHTHDRHPQHRSTSKHIHHHKHGHHVMSLSGDQLDDGEYADQYQQPTVSVKHDGSISDIVTSNRQHYDPTTRQKSTEQQADTPSTSHSRQLLHERHPHHRDHSHHSDSSTDSIKQGGDADAKAINAGGDIAGEYSNYPTGAGYGDTYAKQWNADSVSKFSGQRAAGSTTTGTHSHKHSDSSDSSSGSGSGDYQHYIDQYSNGAGAGAAGQSTGGGSNGDWTKYQQQYAGQFSKYTRGQDRPEKGQWGGYQTPDKQHSKHSAHKHHIKNSHYHKHAADDQTPSSGDYQHYIDQYGGGAQSGHSSSGAGGFDYQQYIPSQIVELHELQTNIRAALFNCLSSESGTQLHSVVVDLISGSEQFINHIQTAFIEAAQQIKALVAQELPSNELHEQVHDIVKQTQLLVRQQSMELHHLITETENVDSDAHSHVLGNVMIVMMVVVIVAPIGYYINRKMVHRSYDLL